MSSLVSDSKQLLNFDNHCPACHPSKESMKVVFAKALFVAFVVAALAVATFFSMTGVFALIASGAAYWQIGLVGLGALLSSVSFLSAIYSAGKHRMFDDTGHNGRDVKDFLLDSLT